MSGIIIASIVFFVIVIFSIVILIIALRKSPTQNDPIDYTNDNINPNVISRINWSENNRGYSNSQFPPCYELSPECKKIFSIIKSYNLEKKYMQLFDVYSIVLCQESQTRDKTCLQTFLNDRIADLRGLDADYNAQNAVLIVKANTNLLNNKIGQFLVMATDLIEKSLKELYQDNTISMQDKEQISGYNSSFYRQHYDFINKRCI